MINTLPPPQVGHQASPRVPKEKSKRAGASVGILVACVVLAIVCVYFGTRIRGQNAALADVKAQLAQSISRASEIQANLDAAKAQSSGLQAQLANDQGQRSDLQAQLDKAKAQSSGLQAQLASDKGQRSDLQAQLDQVKAQLNRAAQESAAYRAQLDQARSHAADTQAQLTKAQGDLTRLHPLIVEARQLPLVATFEKSFWDRGFTLHINNSSSAELKLKITISGAEKTYNQMAVIEGGAALNVERLPAGEVVVIASDGFDPLSLTAR